MKRCCQEKEQKFRVSKHRSFAWTCWLNVFEQLGMYIFDYLKYRFLEMGSRKDRFQLGATCRSLYFIMERAQWSLDESDFFDRQAYDIARHLSKIDFGLTCFYWRGTPRLIFVYDPIFLAVEIEMINDNLMEIVIAAYTTPPPDIDFLKLSYNSMQLIDEALLCMDDDYHSKFRIDVRMVERNHAKSIVGPCLANVLLQHLANIEYRDVEKEAYEKMKLMHLKYINEHLLQTGRKDVFKQPFTDFEKFKSYLLEKKTLLKKKLWKKKGLKRKE
jgi:hypothetical protein